MNCECGLKKKIEDKIKHFETGIKIYAKPGGELVRVYSLVIEELEDLLK